MPMSEDAKRLAARIDDADQCGVLYGVATGVGEKLRAEEPLELPAADDRTAGRWEQMPEQAEQDTAGPPRPGVGGPHRACKCARAARPRWGCFVAHVFSNRTLFG